jgi:hypothetical protein
MYAGPELQHYYYAMRSTGAATGTNHTPSNPVADAIKQDGLAVDVTPI